MWMTAAEIETAPSGWYICYWNGKEESDCIEVLIGPFESVKQAEASALEHERIEISTVSMMYQSIEER